MWPCNPWESIHVLSPFRLEQCRHWLTYSCNLSPWQFDLMLLWIENYMCDKISLHGQPIILSIGINLYAFLHLNEKFANKITQIMRLREWAHCEYKTEGPCRKWNGMRVQMAAKFKFLSILSHIHAQFWPCKLTNTAYNTLKTLFCKA